MSRRLVVMLLALGGVLLSSAGCGQQKTSGTVVVYVSEDQVFSAPIIHDFERATGLRVKAVYDTEEAKGTGVMNRLLAEAGNPQADVYWANEPIRAEVLRQRGISAPYVSPNAATIPAAFKDPAGYWTGFSARARVLVVNSSVAIRPQSVLAYTEPQWRGQAVIANPLFGTTTTQMAALFTVWGDQWGQDFLAGLKQNQVHLSSDNGESTNLVASGQYAFSLVDSDDAINRLRQGQSVEIVYPDQGATEMGCLLVPNAAVLIKGAPHPEAARHFVDFLLSDATERKLAAADCAQLPLHPGVAGPEGLRSLAQLKTMEISYAAVAEKLQDIQPLLKQWVGF